MMIEFGNLLFLLYVVKSFLLGVMVKLRSLEIVLNFDMYVFVRLYIFILLEDCW